jgi:hypothetical protein
MKMPETMEDKMKKMTHNRITAIKIIPNFTRVDLLPGFPGSPLIPIAHCSTGFTVNAEKKIKRKNGISFIYSFLRGKKRFYNTDTNR